jgi:hypothetical protein
MPVVTVILAKALICFAGQCFPALVGPDTVPGTYQMHVMYTDQPGYGGDVLVYRSTDTSWYAIHRTYTEDKSKDRSKLYHLTAVDRAVTKGCINVQPKVYDELVLSQRRSTLEIVEDVDEAKQIERKD